MNPKRTASVRAKAALEVVALDRDQFSDLVRVSKPSAAAVKQTAKTRLARKPVPVSKGKKPPATAR